MLAKIEKIDRFILLFTQNKIRLRKLNYLMKFITMLGDYGGVWLLISGGLLLSRKTRKVAILSFISLILCYLVNNIIIKNVVHRKRPFNQYEDIEELVKKPKDYSFPSGHTCGSFAAAGIYIRFLHGKIARFSILLASIIGYSRIYVGVHYPSDVVIGGMIGILGSQSIYYMYRFLSKKD
ncbi:phosphatase PAP2 family protein [Anaeromicropila herbilytica]|uniref:Phosphatase PAP2 family protein n=1 Tax=Anaeromicropila herbilytica TaxID=2785025 RepID=A0A7R7ID82_9FIRM|nr:phosphatase PAP2 family protein [Anaeromicropila herbilytica]BCN31297.1 phosphatase PAP2 family protein [Anaeromicropila herbilytica]